MTRVVVTGAGGFIGRGVVTALAEAGYEVRAIVRRGGSQPDFNGNVETVVLPGLEECVPELTQACAEARLVVHLADNPERTNGGSKSPALAHAVVRAAQSANVPRAIFASSIYATFDKQGRPNEYGAGKRAAERVFTEAERLETVCLRLPPVYGPGGKGGFALVTRLVATGLPLPFGLAKEPRAYLSRSNLAALIVALAKADYASFKAAAGRIWEPSDGNPVSTADLAKAVAAATDRPSRLFPVPAALLMVPAAMAGKRAGAEAIFASLECADASELERLVGWKPSRDLVANLSYLRD